MRLAAVLAVSLTLTGCTLSGRAPAMTPTPVQGTWQGRVYGPLGKGPAAMVIEADGAYSGTVYLDMHNVDFSGAIVLTSRHRGRYQGSHGNGSVRIAESNGQPVLRFVADGGGGGAEFTPAGAR